MLLRGETIEGVGETALLAFKWYWEGLNWHKTYAGTVSSSTFAIAQTLFV